MLKRNLMLVAVVGALAIPALARNGVESGLLVGDVVTPFNPTHLSGPDKGTNNCPPCTYGDRPAVQIWLNANNSPEDINAFGKSLSKAVEAHMHAEFKAFVINLTHCEACVGNAKKAAHGFKYENVGFATLPASDQAVSNYKVNISPEVKNTVFVYKNKKVVAKFVNLKTDKEGLAQLSAAIEKATS